MAKRSPAEQAAIRQDIFRWLDDLTFRGHYEFSRELLLSYEWRGDRIPLLDQGRGIRNPQGFDATLSIMSGWKNTKYNDFHDDNGWISYAYREGDGGDNIKLIRAHELQTPIVYFRAVRPGHYVAHWPVRIVVNDPERREVRFPLTEEFEFFGDPLQDTGSLTEQQRKYAQRLVKQRLHQPLFRARVLHAYRSSCGICALQHAELLDAAHIIPDAHDAGVASVTNGLALCKIHHAAYDRRLLGITPDYEVRIDHALLEEVDGPMLRHGLQDMHGVALRLPERKRDWPDREALALRYEEFAAA